MNINELGNRLHHQHPQPLAQSPHVKPYGSTSSNSLTLGGNDISGRSFLAAYAAYRRRDNHAEVLAATIQQVRSDLDRLRPADRCLSVGTGTGLHEIEFIETLMPGVRTLVAIEPDAESAAELRVNLRRRLGQIERDVREIPVERWEGTNNKFDVVLLFHFMYYFIDVDARRHFCRQLFDWTSDGGSVVILMDRHDEGPNGIHKVCRAPSAVHSIPSYDRTRADMIDAGFQPDREYEFRYSRDWSNPEPDLLRFIQMVRGLQTSTSGEKSSLDEIRDMMHRLQIDRKTEGRTVLAVFIKSMTAVD